MALILRAAPVIAASASPSLRADVPGLSASCRYSRMISSEPRFSAFVSSHSIFSASRPCFAAQKPVPTTATPPGTCTTDTTPGTALAAVASNDFTFAPKRGGRCSSATRMPGTVVSSVKCAVPFDLADASTRGMG